MIGKEEDISVSYQLGQKISLLPETSQTFYSECLIKEVDDIETYHNEIFAVVNYELLVLEWQAQGIEKITKDMLQLLTPWVMDKNRQAWQAILEETEVDCPLRLLAQAVKFRKELLIDPTKFDFEHGLINILETGKKNKLSIKKDLESTGFINYHFVLSMTLVFNEPDKHIEELMEVLERHGHKNERLFYQELLKHRDDLAFKKRVRDILRMHVALKAIDETLPLTHEKLSQVIQMFDKEVRQHFEPHDTTIDPKDLFAAFKQHLNGMIEALNTLDLDTKASNEAVLVQEKQPIIQPALNGTAVPKQLNKNTQPLQQRQVNPQPQQPQGRQKVPVSFGWALLQGLFWACVGALVGLIVFIAPIPVTPMLFIGWCAGAAFGLSAMENGFSNILGEGSVVTSSLCWGGGLASIGAVIGGIVGTFLLPGFGTLSGAAAGALMGAGVGAGVALVTGPLIRFSTWLYDRYKAQPSQEPKHVHVANQMAGLGKSNACGVNAFEDVLQSDGLFVNSTEEYDPFNIANRMDITM